VITLGHVFEQIVAGQIDVVNDLAQVTLEIGIGQSNQVIQSVLGNVSLPLKSALTLITELSQVFGTILDVHPSNEGVLELQALSRSGNYKKIEYPIPKSTSILFSYPNLKLTQAAKRLSSFFFSLDKRRIIDCHNYELAHENKSTSYFL